MAGLSRQEKRASFSQWEFGSTWFDDQDPDPSAAKSSGHTQAQSLEEETRTPAILKPKHDSEFPPGAASEEASQKEQDTAVEVTYDDRELQWFR